MQKKSEQKLFSITLIMRGGAKRIVEARASTLEVAENRALKRVPEAIEVYRGEEER